MKYFEEARDMWHEYVPKAGQANTVQGELLRAVEKLRDEAYRNGNLNWDSGFEILLRYLENHLTDPQVFSNETINETKSILQRLSDFDDPYLDEDLYDILGDRVVEYYKHYGSKPHNNDPALLR